MTDLLGDCACSCCRHARIVVADLTARLRAVEDRAANDRRERDQALARLPHGGYGPVHAEPEPEPRRRFDDIRRWRP